jgi:hypothetical protein
MLIRFSKQWRMKAAGTLVVLYALCVLGPPAAFAFGDGAQAAHCLTDKNHGLGTVHVHEDGVAYKHSDDGDDQKALTGKCCGLVCLFALAPALYLDAAQFIPLARVLVLSEDSVFGRGLDQLYRPPISLQSL